MAFHLFRQADADFPLFWGNLLTIDLLEAGWVCFDPAKGLKYIPETPFYVLCSAKNSSSPTTRSNFDFIPGEGFPMVRKFAALAAVAAVIATPAFAADAAVAQLSTVKGSVMVTSNGKTAPATAAALKAGDRVVASKGTASVKFADGCVVALKAGSMVTVGAKSPCAAGAGVVSTNGADAQFLKDASPFTKALLTFVVAGAIIGAVSEGSSGSP
jgi:hypothetical protein